MKIATSGLPKEFFIDGSLAIKRNTFLRNFLILLNIFMLPLGIYWLFNDFLPLGLALLLFLTTFNYNVFLSFLRRPFIVAYPIVILTLSLSLFLAVYYIGFSAALWTYPIVISLYFIIPIRPANYCNLIIVLPIVTILFIQFDWSLAIRYSASLAATMILGMGLVNTIVELQRKLLRQSTTDPLTGAFNRRHMDRTLSVLSKRYGKTPEHCTILMLDIDHFKKINDKFGHESGDIALQDLVTVLNKNIRKTDVIFRMGGEEFIVLLLDTDLQMAVKIAESLRIEASKIPVSNSDTMLTVSIGVSLLTANMSYSQWLKEADNYLYEAKRLGRNRVVTEFAAS